MDFAILDRQGDDAVVVMLNASTATRRVAVPLSGHLPDDTVLECPWSREGGKVDAGRFGPVELAPRSAKVFATPIS